MVAGGYRYLFLDPLYMLVGSARVTDGGDELRPILTWLTRLKNRTGCAAVVTHHMTDKGGKNAAGSLLGTTFIHGWYEASVFVRQGEHKTFEVRLDAQRDFGSSDALTMIGLGVGRWSLGPTGGSTDSAGRSSPRIDGKAARAARARELHEMHPLWTYQEIADEVGVTSVKTVQRYLAGAEDPE